MQEYLIECGEHFRWLLLFQAWCWKTAKPTLKIVSEIETPTQVFSCEICETFGDIFFTERLRWLVLIKVFIKLYTCEGKTHYHMYSISESFCDYFAYLQCHRIYHLVKQVNKHATLYLYVISGYRSFFYSERVERYLDNVDRNRCLIQSNF